MTPNYDYGVRLGHTPQINEGDFVGREKEVEQLETWLTPRAGSQNVVALYGSGGMGKTQLSVHYAKRFGSTYSSLFWLDAKDESTLKGGMAKLAAEVTEERALVNLADSHEEARLVQQMRQWLSRPTNDRWLMVYDNYDDPRLPGMDSVTGYDIRDFFPHRSQGSILITTRSPRLTFCKSTSINEIEGHL